MGSKQYVVIGLGRFGSSIAKTLYALGNDVLAIDNSEERVQDISDSVTHAVQADSTDENALRSLGIKNFDVGVISIGSYVQASIMTTLLLKDMGVKYIIAKAHNDIHAKVLYKIGADRVVFPERDMGTRVAHNLLSSNILDYIELSPDYNIVEIVPIIQWKGKALKDLNLRTKYGINVVAIKRDNGINISPDAHDIIKEGDVLVVIGGTEEVNKIQKSNKG